MTVTNSWKRTTAALILFGASFGFVEAAVVIYLRALYEPLRRRFLPGADPRDLFPLITLDQLRQAWPQYGEFLATELMREAATMVLLVSIGLALSRNFRQGLAAFVIAFGIWDIAFYTFLKLRIGWPASLFDWDLLFLIPAPWIGPVIAPVLVAATMIAGGFLVLGREWSGRPLRAAPWHWAGVVLGGLVIIASFLGGGRAAAAGALPAAFNWPLFWLGEAIGIASFLHAWRRT